MKKVIDSFEKEYDFLSNFYVAPVDIYELKGVSTESVFQAMKSLNIQERNEIASCLPSRAKRLGRKVNLRQDWDDIKDDVMYDVVLAKFKQNPILKQKLLDTADAILVEGNTWGDKYWGVCDGIGLNKLGQTLMRVREELSK